MILGDSTASVELTITVREPLTPGASAGGDVLVEARVRCLGFAGEIDAWVGRHEWAAFLEQLTCDRRRQGHQNATSS